MREEQPDQQIRRAEESLGDDLLRAVEESIPERRQMKADLEPLIRGVYTEALNLLEEAIPDARVPDTTGGVLFSTLRRRMLNAGNEAVRALPLVLRCYLVKQILTRETVTYSVPGKGPFNLPEGVELRSQATDTR